MSIIDDIREAMHAFRKVKPASKGKALYELNHWKGEERKRLDAEYDARRAAIEAQPDEQPQDGIPAEVLALVAQAVLEGVSRSNIRIALGKQTLQEADEVIALARGDFAHRIETGEADLFTLRPTGTVHSKGWPMYQVTLHDTEESYMSVYLVTPPTAGEVKRSHMRLLPSPPGSAEILDRLWEAGVGDAIWEKGK